MASARYGARIVTVRYTLLLVFTTGVASAFAVKEPVRPGEYTLYAFEGVPDGAWTDAEFIKEIEGKGVRIKVGESDAKTVEVPLIPRSDIAVLLTRLGMD